MSDDGEEVCGAPLKTKDGTCDRTATCEDSRCRYHTELEDQSEKWDGRPEKHGFYANRGGYYESLPKKDQEWIDIVTNDLVEKSYFDKDDPLPMEKLRQVAVDLHQRRRADEYIAQKGLTQEKDIGFHEEYGMVTQEEENTLMITKDRLSRESRMTCREFGVLDGADESSNQETESLIESLSE
jgi:hypothetical protein